MKGTNASAGKRAHAVQMVADEVFCWLPTMSASRGVPLLRVSPSNTRCLASESRAAGCALLQNEYSDEVWVLTRLYCKEFAGSKPASVTQLLQEETRCQKLNRLGR